MPVPAGKSTPWREIPDSTFESGVSYLREGRVAGAFEWLAEQLRVDGVLPGTGIAMRVAEEAALRPAWFGTDEFGQDVLCDEDGWTEKGYLVPDPQGCVVAHVTI